MVASLQTIMHSLPGDAPDARDDAAGMDVAAVHAHCGQLRQLQERRARIDQAATRARGQQLAAGAMPLLQLVRSAFAGLAPLLRKIGDERTHRRGVGLELLGRGEDLGADARHG